MEYSQHAQLPTHNTHCTQPQKIEQKLVKNGEKRSMAPKGAIFSPVKMPIGYELYFYYTDYLKIAFVRN